MLPEWEEAIEHAAEAATTMVIGESDTGKTTLVTALANALHSGGAVVGVVDGDLGQSEIGPPTTIGFGRVTRPLARLAEAELLALHFVGRTSPAGNVLGALVGAHRLTDRARRSGCQRILIDTSGLVSGDIGWILKQAKIDLLRPDLVICLEHAGECEGIVRPYLSADRPAVLRLPVPPGVRSRSAAERRRHRRERLRAYFAPATHVRLDLRRVLVRQPPLVSGRPIEAADLAMTLVGLEDARGETLGLGRVLSIDFNKLTMALHTVVDPRTIAAVTVGRERYADESEPRPGQGLRPS